MKKKYFIFLFILGCSKIGFPWNEITFEEAGTLSQLNNKIIMIDFYADW